MYDIFVQIWKVYFCMFQNWNQIGLFKAFLILLKETTYKLIFAFGYKTLHTEHLAVVSSESVGK